MRLLRGVLVVAVVAALWGAPQSVSAAVGEGSDRAGTEEMVSDLILIGVAGVASVAIIGTLLLVAGRRREPGRAVQRAEPSAEDDAIMRRVARSGRVRPAADPIVAALGIDEEMAARRAIRHARQRRDGDTGAERHPAAR